MKKLLYLISLILFTISANAQSVFFIHPSNGEALTGSYSETQIALNISYNWEITPYPPRISLYDKRRLVTHSGSYESTDQNGIPQWFYLPAGTYTWRIELWETFLGGQGWEKTAEQTITFHVKFILSVKNSFGSGTINIDGITSSSGGSKLKFIGDNLAVGAIDQHFNNYDRVWNTSGTNNSTWQRKSKGSPSFEDLNGATSRNHNYSVQSNDNYATIQAVMKKECNISFSNQFSGASGGQIKVNGVWKNAPTANFPTVEQNLITAEAKSQYEMNDILYHFQKWDDNLTTRFRDIYPSAHKTYKAIYKGSPIFDETTQGGNLRNLAFSATSPHGYIKLTWNEHPNQYVTKYYVYRYYKHNGVVSSPRKIATLNRGTLSYTDVEYELNQSGGDFILWYDVRAYFSLDGTTSPVRYQSTKGDQSGTLSKISSGDEITYYDITNYPNPYNPQTTIRFQLPQEGFVTIKVYNSLGEEIKTLLNEQKDYGRYELKFDGSDLPSGMYIYTIKVNDYYVSKKMLLVK